MATIAELFIKFSGSSAALERSTERVKLNVKQTAKEIRKETGQARDATELLGRTFGVQLPRQVQKFAASVAPVRRLLAGAFQASIVAGFSVAVIALIPKIKELATEFGGMGEAMKKLADENIRANEALLLGSKAGATLLLRQVNEQIGALEKPQGTFLGAALGAAFPGTGIGKALAMSSG